MDNSELNNIILNDKKKIIQVILTIAYALQKHNINFKVKFRNNFIEKNIILKFLEVQFELNISEFEIQ